MKNKQHTLPSFFLISSAVDGNENAIEKLLLFYEAYISKCCLRPFYDEYGNVYIVVDMELKGRIREALLKSGKHRPAHLRKAVEGNGSRHHQYAECYPDGHSDQLCQGAAGSAGRTAEGTASPHCRGTAGKTEDERRIRPVLAAPFPQAGYDPAGAAAGTGGYLHQCHLSL